MIAIFDIDGVIADTRHRHKLLTTDYEASCALLQYDKVWEEGRKWYKYALDNNLTVVFVTAREERHKADTCAWLRVNLDASIQDISVFCKPPEQNGDADFVVKQKILNNNFYTMVAFAVEDNIECARMYQDNGITCLFAEWSK